MEKPAHVNRINCRYCTLISLERHDHRRYIPPVRYLCQLEVLRSLPKAVLRIQTLGSIRSCSLLQGVFGLTMQPQGVVAQVAKGRMTGAHDSVQPPPGTS